MYILVLTFIYIIVIINASDRGTDKDHGANLGRRKLNTPPKLLDTQCKLVGIQGYFGLKRGFRRIKTNLT